MRLDLSFAALGALSLCFVLPDSDVAVAAEATVETPLETGTLSLQSDSGDLESLRAAFESAARTARPAAQGYAMRSTASPLVAHFDGRGMSVDSDQAPWNWGLELTSYGFPGSELAVDEPLAMQAAGSRLAYHWGADLEEWYVNQARGLEHGFTLAKRPQGADPGELLMFDMNVRGDLAAQVSANGRDVNFNLPTGEVAISYAGLVVFDATGAEFDARFTSDDDGLQLVIDEAAATYPLTIDPIVQQEYLKASNADAQDHFGGAVAISGDTAVIGASRESSNATCINGYESNNLTAGAGAAYVFVRTGGVWTQQAYLKSSNPNVDDFFGHSVAIDGDTIAISALGERSQATGVGGNQLDNSTPWAGAVYVFRRSGSTWSQEAYLKASNTEGEDFFGGSVSLSGDRLVVGAAREDSASTGVGGDEGDNSATDSGAAYLFTRTGSTWGNSVYLKASNAETGDLFGNEVAIQGTRVLIGARSEDSSAVGINGDETDNSAVDSGAAYVFELVGGQWSQVAYVKASNADAFDNFGVALDLDGDTLAVAADREASGFSGINGNQNDNSAPVAGAAYVFSQVGGNWIQEAFIKSSNPLASSFFGYAIALDGDRLAVGAPNEDGASTGIDGNEYDVTSANTGATYLFERAAGTWSQTSYIKGAAVDVDDYFGGAVALSGDVLISGVSGEDSGASGIGGDPSGNSKMDSGAVYVHDLAANCGVTAYGPSSGGNVADLALPLTPNVGGKATLELWNFSGNGVALLFISTEPSFAPLFDGTLLINLNKNVLGPGGYVPVSVMAGTGQVSFGLPPSLAGLTFYCQAAMADPLLPSGFAFTNGLEVTVCN